MIQTEYFGAYTIELWEYMLLPVFLIIIFSISARIKNRRIEKEPYYKYYIPGVLAKVFGGLGLCFVYVYYYRGGDTIMYYESSWAMTNLFWDTPGDFFTVLFGDNTREHHSLFSNTTGFPYEYLYFDHRTFLVIRIVSPIMILCFKSYILSTVVLAWVAYSGLWRLFVLFCTYYKDLHLQFAIAILFFPSVVFWGSGILKDTITLSATCWFVYSFYKIFLQKKSRFKHTIALLLSGFLIVSIKPYIILTLLPGALSWVFFERINRIRNRFLKYMLIPVIFIACLGGALAVLSLLGNMLDKFSLDKVIETAVVTQNDLKQDYYQGNSFDIGEIDPSLAGIIAKAPLAITAGIYRPFLWDSNNAVMLISALENTFVLGLSLFLLIRIKVRRLLAIFFNNPLLLFCISYAVLFAFSIGLTTSNFGALVRFKIPYISFFISGLFILLYFNRKENRKLVKVAHEEMQEKSTGKKAAPMRQAAVSRR